MIKKHLVGLTFPIGIFLIFFAMPALASGLDDVFEAKGSSPMKIEVDELQFVVGSLDESQQKKLFEDKELFGKFLEKENERKSLLFVAQKKGVKKSSVEEYWIRRQAEQLLINHYLREQLKTVDDNYPSEEQIQAYHDNNKDSFVLEERVQISQIYLPFAADSGDDEIAEKKKKAEKIVKDISRGKLSFSDAATQFSKHDASKLNGGHMGLVKMSVLVPEIKEAISTLKVGQVSQPIKADDGYHVLKLGSKVSAQPVSFEQVRESIRQLLVKEKFAAKRQQVVDKVLEKYPAPRFLDKNVEKMRKKLLNIVVKYR